MKEKETSKLYNSITNVNSQFVEEAQTKIRKKGNRWLKWGAVAACLCLILTAVVVTNRHPSQPDISNISFTGISADWPSYPNTAALIDSSDAVVLGTVKSLSFQLLDIRTARPATDETDEHNALIYTLYDIDIIEQYKGDLGAHTQIRVMGGLEGQYLEEQVSLLGDRAAYGIPCLNGMPAINIGETYLFVLHQYENTAPTLLNPTQSVFSCSNPGLDSDASSISLQSILSYFGDDPL